MFRVLLADDEKMSLVSVEHSFPWKQYGFQTPLKTTDSYQACKILFDQKIDAAFVDIRMPGMSGLEIVEACRKQDIPTEFIIVSGYSDFVYAKQAIQLGAFDFCVKPVQEEEAPCVLQQLFRQLCKRRIETDTAELFLLRGENTLGQLSRRGLNTDRGWLLIADLTGDALPFADISPLGEETSFLLSEKHEIRLCSLDAPLTDVSAPKGGNMLFCQIPLADAGRQLPAVLKLLQTHRERGNSSCGCVEVDVFGLLCSNDSFLTLVDYVEQHYDKELSLRTLAEQFNLNYTYCSELFPKVIGTSFSQYVTSLRLARACTLLDEGTLSIEQIAEKVGFSSSQYFTSVFKKAYSTTPAQYGKERRSSM